MYILLQNKLNFALILLLLVVVINPKTLKYYKINLNIQNNFIYLS